MSTLEFLSYLRSLDVKLSADGDRLRCSAPEGVLTSDLRAELADRKSDLLALLRPNTPAATRPARPPLTPAPPGRAVPLSFSQERLWKLIDRTPSGATYNLSLAFRLRGPLKVDVLEQSIGEIVRRHDVLRTTFVTTDDGIRPVAKPHQPFSLPLRDLSRLTASDASEAVEAEIYQTSQRPFDLANGPLLRTSLLRQQADEHVLVLAMHHIVADGWSFDVFLSELADLYAAYGAGQTSPLSELPVQYADYAVWQRSTLQGEVLEALRRYWSSQLNGDVAALELPTARRADGWPSYDGNRRTLLLSAALTARVKALAKRAGATLFMTLLAAFKALLHRYTGQTDIALCSPVACRNQEGLQPLIGYFNNLIVLRTDLSGTPSFQTLLQRVRRTAMGAYQHQDFPFQKLARLPSGAPTSLTHGMFTLRQDPPHALTLHGLTVEPLPVPNDTSNFDLSLSVQTRESGMEATLAYKTALFDEKAVAAFLNNYRRVLDAVTVHPEQPIAALLPSLNERPSRAARASNALRNSTNGAPHPASTLGFSVPAQPRTALELQLVKIWEDLLRTAPIGVRDDFFDLGGHSLLAARLFERIERTLGRRLPVASIFRLSTAEALAGALENAGWSPNWSALVPIQPGGSKPPIFCVHSWEGHVLFYRDLVHHLDADQPFYALQSIGLDGQAAPLTRVEDMAAHYVREIRSLQPHGPYYLAGRCFGATVAYEMAQQLRATDEEVADLLILDSGFVGNREYLEPTLKKRSGEHLGPQSAMPWYGGLPPGVTLWIRRFQRVRDRPWLVIDKIVKRFKSEISVQGRRFERVRQTNWKVATQYTPTPYPGPITLLFSEESAADEEKAWYRLSWEVLAQGGISFYTVPGQHGNIMDEPHVRGLAEQLQVHLQKTHPPFLH